MNSPDILLCLGLGDTQRSVTPVLGKSYGIFRGQAISVSVQRTIYFSGEVQGVGFRATTERFAVGRPLTGYVRNLPDRRVELLVEGMPVEIDRLLMDLHQHFGTMVCESVVETASATSKYTDFSVRR